VNRATRHIGGERLAFVTDRAGEIEQPAENRVTNRHF
jgi:hypothetical protein